MLGISTLSSMKNWVVIFDVIDKCGLQDLGYVGNKFTWAKHYLDGTVIWECLDRAFGIEDCVSLFPAFQVVHLECGMSDHKLVHIHPLGISARRQKPWRFEQVWLFEEGYHDTVRRAWEVDSDYFSIG